MDGHNSDTFHKSIRNAELNLKIIVSNGQVATIIYGIPGMASDMKFRLAGWSETNTGPLSWIPVSLK